MAGYIDRDKLYEHVYAMGMDFDLIEALEVIENFPAEDVEHVVRCKDCIYYHPDSCVLPDGRGANWGVCEKLLDSDAEDERQTIDQGFCWFAMKAGEKCD